MIINDKILEVFHEEASLASIDQITIGLGYTALTLTDGRCGLCSTLIHNFSDCPVSQDPLDYEKKPALPLLQKITSKNPLARVLAIALVNALNYNYAYACSEDSGQLIQDLHLRKYDKVAMVGYFRPVAAYFEEGGIEVKSYDIGKQMGNLSEFYHWACSEADAVVITATSLINGTIEEVLAQLQEKTIPAVIMGPSTIMRPEIYSHLKVTMLAGTVALDTEAIVKAVRNGKGTRVLHKHAKKVQLMI